MNALSDTQDAIKRLKAAGLKHGKEFSARKERILRNGQFVGYGDLVITLYCPVERMWELAPVIAQQDFHVEQFVLDGRKSIITVSDTGDSGLFIREWIGNSPSTIRKVEVVHVSYRVARS